MENNIIRKFTDVILNESSEHFDEKELEMGIKVEMEHNDIWGELDDYCRMNDIPNPFSEKEFYTRIAKAHLKELPDYYSRLKVMES